MKGIKKINKRHKQFMDIINFFSSHGAKDIILYNNYDVMIIITQWGKGIEKKQINDLVDHLISKCPKSEFFSLVKNCNCVYVKHKDIFDNN